MITHTFTTIKEKQASEQHMKKKRETQELPKETRALGEKLTNMHRGVAMGDE